MTTEMLPSGPVLDTAVPSTTKTDELKQSLKRQVEYYFSKQNLTHDSYLVSQMNAQMYVPLDVIVEFSKVKELTSDVELLVEALASSTICSFNDDKSGIKPNIKTERNTIILREIPSDTTIDQVKTIFDGCGGTVSNVRSDVGDTWFVTMSNEEEAVQTLLALRSQTFNGLAIKARLKSESTLRTILPNENSKAKYAKPSNRDYYPNNTNMNYYMTSPTYGAPYHGHHHMYRATTGLETPRFRARSGRENALNFNGNPNPNPNRYPSSTSKEPKGKPNLRKNKDKRHGKGDKKMAKKPAMNSANFPPLSTSDLKKEPMKSGFATSFHKYTEDDIMEIVKNMSHEDCSLSPGDMDLNAHGSALNVVAHVDLLKSQRTYSIEQARDAMRQGRPIRSDSIGSMDYESMMYGEEYTREARAERQDLDVLAPVVKDPLIPTLPIHVVTKQTTPQVKRKTSELAPPPKVSEPQQEPRPKKSGYAAALLSTPPASVSSTTLMDKKSKGKKPETFQSQKSETSVWGSKRSFLDVVKTEQHSNPTLMR